MLTLDEFLISVQGRAYGFAMMAVKNEADALDIVQDSMIKLASHYGHFEHNDQSEQWRPLFFTILQNCIMDFHRKQNRLKHWFSWGQNKQDDDERMEHEIAQDQLALAQNESPEQHLIQGQMGKQALAAIEELPIKQQQCFLLRNWEGFSVQETASAMNISSGSVKTHYHRAMEKIKKVMYEEA